MAGKETEKKKCMTRIPHGGAAATVLGKLRCLEGRQVDIALADGSRIDGAVLQSAGRGSLRTAWVFHQGADHFVPVSSVIDVWPSQPVRDWPRRRHASGC